MKNPLLTTLIFLLLSASSWAADITLFAGVQREGKITLNSAATAGGPATQILKNPFKSGNFGIRVGSGKVWGHEETIAYSPNFIDSNSQALILNSNALISIPAPVVKPYITAGLGTFVVRGSGISDIGTKFALNYGGGVKILPAGPVGIRGDIRGYTLTSVQGHKMNV